MISPSSKMASRTCAAVAPCAPIRPGAGDRDRVRAVTGPTGFCQISDHQRCRARYPSRSAAWRLRRRHLREQRAPARDEERALLCQRDMLASPLVNSEVLPELIERGTETGGGCEIPEAEHRIIPLLDGPMALLGQVVQVSIASVQYRSPQDPADGSAVGRMGIGRDPQRLGACHLHQPSQKAPGGVLVAVLAEHGVEEVAIAVDGAVEIAPAARDLHVGLIDVPGDPGAAAPLGPEPLRQQRRETELPVADGLVRDRVPPLGSSSATSRKPSL